MVPKLTVGQEIEITEGIRKTVITIVEVGASVGNEILVEYKRKGADHQSSTFATLTHTDKGWEHKKT